MTESTAVTTRSSDRRSGDSLHMIGTGAPEEGTRPVRAGDRAVIGVFADIDAAQTAVERLIAAGLSADRLSIMGRDLQSGTRVNGFVTTGEIAGTATATGGWVGGPVGLLRGTALLFVPDSGSLVVLGPLAGAAAGAGRGELVGGGVGAVLGHFVADQHIPKYLRAVRAGNCLLVAYGTEQEVAQGERVLADSAATDVERHDIFRSDPGPIADVHEGMRVVDAAGQEVGKVAEVKMGDPGAVTTQGQTLGLDPMLDVDTPHLPPPLAERLLRTGFLEVDRKGLFRRDVYVGADQIATVDDGTVHLAVDQDALPGETA